MPILVALLLFGGAVGAVWIDKIGPDTVAAAAAVEATAIARQEAAARAAQVAETGGDATIGQEKYSTVCVACHGPQAEGVENLGKNLQTSEFVGDLTDAELVEFIKVGRAVDDPLNTSGVAMPAKGGNPSLTDEDLFHIVAFIRSVRQ